MREILFRGKTKSDGRWVEGYLSETTILTLSDTYTAFVINKKPSGVYDDEWDEVIPETVGQYTGFCNKNGKKIFEGDIVKIEDDSGDTAFVNGGIGEVSFCDGSWYVWKIRNSLYNLTRGRLVSVIGNIHDNPELLKKESETR